MSSFHSKTRDGHSSSSLIKFTIWRQSDSKFIDMILRCREYSIVHKRDENSACRGERTWSFPTEPYKCFLGSKSMTKPPPKTTEFTIQDASTWHLGKHGSLRTSSRHPSVSIVDTECWITCATLHSSASCLEWFTVSGGRMSFPLKTLLFLDFQINQRIHGKQAITVLVTPYFFDRIRR